MESVRLKSGGLSSITFVEREPIDTSKPIDYFTVQLRDANLSASARVYAFCSGGLADLFAQVAANWQDFVGPEMWSSLEGEFKLVVDHDGLGHFTFAAELRSGLYPTDWIVQSSVILETSQLDGVAAEVSEFLGRQA